MKTPKVILISGCPGAGKTTLGRALAARLGYVSLTIDDLQGAVRALTTPESHPGLHLMNQPNFVRYFTDSSVDKLIADANAQHEAIWPAVERTIINHASWGTPLVLDGWHMRPEWTARLEAPEISSHWIVIDTEALRERERGNTEFFGASDNPARMFENFLGRSSWYNTLIDRQATAADKHILRQDGTRSVDELCDEVLARAADDSNRGGGR